MKSNSTGEVYSLCKEFDIGEAVALAFVGPTEPPDLLRSSSRSVMVCAVDLEEEGAKRLSAVKPAIVEESFIAEEK